VQINKIAASGAAFLCMTSRSQATISGVLLGLNLLFLLRQNHKQDLGSLPFIVESFIG
jgi:hypothetical protein